MAHIAIIGAGIGGISTAIMLSRFGIECTVFEQSNEFTRLGAGINFGANGTRVFRAMGLGEKMLEVGVRPISRSNRRWDTGEPFYVVDNIANTKKYGSEFIAFHRADLHSMLVEAAGIETFCLGKRLVELGSDEGGVRLRFADGTEETFDAVIGADGLNSVVRKHVGVGDPHYFGHAAYRAIVPTEVLKGRIELNDYIRWWGPEESYVLAYCMKEDRKEYNIVASAPEPLTDDELRPMPTSVEHMLSVFQNFHADAQLVLRNCQEVSRWPMMLRPA